MIDSPLKKDISTLKRRRFHVVSVISEAVLIATFLNRFLNNQTSEFKNATRHCNLLSSGNVARTVQHPMTAEPIP
ncbi:MAG: hypothetical protein CMJ77_17645 [Planctomycetaceae bacterium]|nr:hypothetical protein [Planctomycetaceae bacterium]